jgi:excisionase family DNA binding protein
MENGFLTVKEASRYLGVKPSSLYSMVDEKEIPHYRIGRLIKFTKADLDAFMEERRVDRVDIEKEARKILNLARNPNIDVDALVKKTVAESRGNRYTASHRESDRVKGLGKEVSHGAL